MNLNQSLISKTSSVEIFNKLFNYSNISSGESSEIFINKFGNKNGLLKELNVNQNNGLNTDDLKDIEERVKLYGKNEQKEANSFLAHFLECLKDRTLQILHDAASVCLGIGVLQKGFDTILTEGTEIFLTLFIVLTIITFYNWEKEILFRALNKEMQNKSVFVRRNGTKVKLSAYNLVVGDLVEIKKGDKVIVDGVLIEGDLKMDERAFTGGKFKPIKKTTEIIYIENGKKQTCPFILSGTEAIEGEGVLVVCAVREKIQDKLTK